METVTGPRGKLAYRFLGGMYEQGKDASDLRLSGFSINILAGYATDIRGSNRDTVGGPHARVFQDKVRVFVLAP